MLPCSKSVVCCAVGNADWKSAEVERFQQALVEYDKDFVKIAQRVGFFKHYVHTLFVWALVLSRTDVIFYRSLPTTSFITCNFYTHIIVLPKT